MTWVRFLGYAAFSALGRVYQVVILDKILSWCIGFVRSSVERIMDFERLNKFLEEHQVHQRSQKQRDYPLEEPDMKGYQYMLQ
jgi:hypothetical protein